MGKCSFCGKDAGFLKNSHTECRQKHNAAVRSIVSVVSEAIRARSEPEAVERRVRELAVGGWVPEQLLCAQLIQAWEEAVDAALRDSILSEDEDRALVNFYDHFHLQQADLDKRGAYSRLVKSVVLREIINGKVPSRIIVDGTLPFTLQKSEHLVWVFPKTRYLEYKTSRSYVGRSAGASFRVMKGVYYHLGAFKGHPVEQTQLMPIDLGTFALTTKNLYFGGSAKNFRIPFSKIVSYSPYSDGMGIWRDAANAKEQIFIDLDQWT